MLRQVKLSMLSFFLAIIINFTLPLKYGELFSISLDNLSLQTLPLTLKCKLIEMSLLLPMTKENKLHRYRRNKHDFDGLQSFITASLPTVLDSCSSWASRTCRPHMVSTSSSSHFSTSPSTWLQGWATPLTCHGTASW